MIFTFCLAKNKPQIFWFNFVFTFEQKITPLSI